MKRLVLNLAALAVVVSGGTYLASSAQANDSLTAVCGGCSGVCCGFNSDGTCWARDNCVVEPT